MLVHCITQKGRGFKAAEEHEQDRFHAVGKIDEVTGESLAELGVRTWTDAFGDELARIGATDEQVVAITAAMLHPTGLDRFARHFPDRVFDVGIAEQHAVTSAAGLAAGGLHPVVAVYATFLNRAFDQVLMDVALHRQGVTFVLDRAGVTGPDGASHNGMWDASLLGLVPGLRLTAPRDEQRLQEALRLAVTVDDAPTVLRYSKEPLPEPLPAVAEPRRCGRAAGRPAPARAGRRLRAAVRHGRRGRPSDSPSRASARRSSTRCGRCRSSAGPARAGRRPRAGGHHRGQRRRRWAGRPARRRRRGPRASTPGSASSASRRSSCRRATAVSCWRTRARPPSRSPDSPPKLVAAAERCQRRR